MKTFVKFQGFHLESARCFFILVTALAFGGALPHASAATNNVVGTYTNWPTNWIALPTLNDPNDGKDTQNDFVGDVTNPTAYYGINTEYIFFRMRVQVPTVVAGTTFHDAHTVLIDLTGRDYNTTTKALQSGTDGRPDYGFCWDSKSNDNTKHGFEMQVRSTVGTVWSAVAMDDIDYDAGKKGTNDINGNSRTADGYVRTIDQQTTANFGMTTYVDLAVKWSYLQTYTGLNTNQVWRITLGSIANATDHNNINADIAGGANPTSVITDGWKVFRSTQLRPLQIQVK